MPESTHREASSARLGWSGLLEGLPQGIVLLDEEGRTLEANPAALRLLRLGRQMVGSPDRLDPVCQVSAEDGSPLPLNEQAWFEGGAALVRVRLDWGDGAPVWLEVSAIPLEEGALLLSYQDITERRITEASQRLQALALDQALDMVTVTDLFGQIAYVNEAQCRVFGETREALIGQTTEFYSADPVQAEQQRFLIQETLAKGHWHGKVINGGRDGALVHVDLRTSLVRDAEGRPFAMLGVGTDVTGWENTKDELLSVNRHLRAISDCNLAIIHATDEEALLNEVCRIIVEVGGYRLAWVGLAEQDAAKTVRPVAQAGLEVGYLQTLGLTWADTERGRGPTGTAIRTGCASSARNILTDPHFTPWRAEAIRRGYASSLVLPMFMGTEVFGALNIYSARPDAFDAKEAHLLTELANTLAFGVSALRTRTARQQSEAALEKSMERFRQISEAAEECIWEVDPEGLYTHASPVVEQLLGYTPEELVGKVHFFDLFPEAERAVLVPVVFETFARREPIRGLLNTVFHKDGREVLLETTGLPILGPAGEFLGYRGVDRDMTERRQAEQFLRESEERFRSLFDHTPVAVLEEDFSRVAQGLEALRQEGVTDLRAHLAAHPEVLQDLFSRVRVLEINAAGLRLLGGASQMELTRRRPECFTEASLAVIREEFAQLFEGRTEVELELPLLDLAGRPLELKRRLSVVPGHEGDLSRVLVSLVDRTEEVRAELERGHMEKELNHLQRLESLGRLASGVSHDMNNVLGAIMAVASLLKARHPNQPAIVKDAESLLQAAVRGRDLVKGLRDFSRKDLDAAVALDLNELVRKEADLLERTTLKKVAIQLDLEEGLPECLGEASALTNALMNLCLNAYDAMPGGGRILLSTRLQRPGNLVLTVEDDGEGMPPDVLARAMEPFFTTKPMGKGTGLGLSQVYGTMRAHGGAMDIQSQQGHGTRVTLTFPLASEQVPAPGGAEAAPASPQRTLRVLLVDDDELLRETFLSMLEVVGHHPQGVSGGQEALRSLAEGPTPDLVIMDINMPDMDGLETLSHLRSRWPRLPVLMLSGYVDDRAQKLLEDFPGVRTLKKPCDMADLRQVLQGWV